MFERKHRRPCGVNEWVTQSYRKRSRVLCHKEEATGYFGMEFFVKVPFRAHTAIAQTEVHVIAINKIDCSSTTYPFTVKAIDKLCDRYQVIWNNTLEATERQMKQYTQAKKVSQREHSVYCSPLTVKQKHHANQEGFPSYQFPCLARSVWTASNPTVAIAQKLCTPINGFTKGTSRKAVDHPTTALFQMQIDSPSKSSRLQLETNKKDLPKIAS